MCGLIVRTACEKEFTRAGALETHQKTCDGAKKAPTRAAEKAAHRALHILGLPDVHVTTAGFMVGDDVLPEHAVLVARAEHGWARRPPRGQRTGTSNIKAYAEYVSRSFEGGEADKAKKLQSSQMIERIMAEHPGRLDVPTEGDLRKEVSRLVAARKRTSERAAAAAVGGTARAEVLSAAVIDGAEKGDRRYRMPNKYAEAIQGMVAEDAGREARPGGGGTEMKVPLWPTAALWLPGGSSDQGKGM
jgi:hypothetical protein